MNNENKICNVYETIGSNYPYCGNCKIHIKEHMTIPRENAVRKIEPLPESMNSYSDAEKHFLLWNKVNELIKIINKN
jgi:hypothetical protein